MQRKLLVIMFTDFCGYTAFSSTATLGSVESAVEQQQKLIPPIIEKFEGRIVKWIGDAVMAVFESAIEAIQCGHELQKTLVALGERGETAVGNKLKVVVNLGDVAVDSDGDVYGDAVNVAARIEKCADPFEVYFSNAVRAAIPRAEIPYELVGAFEFKGVPEPTKVFRTCFGKSPVLRERIALVKTDFVGILGLADQLGWDAVHPRLDRAVGALKQAARNHQGCFRSSSGSGSLLTFETIRGALCAVHEWLGSAPYVEADEPAPLQTRVAVHWGTMHIMEHTMMGQDIHLVETLTPLSDGSTVLLTDDARDAWLREKLPESLLEPVGEAGLRDCNTKRKWLRRYEGRQVYGVGQAALPKLREHSD